MPTPIYFNDGDYKVERQVGAPILKRPFFDKGDSVSFEYVYTYRVDHRYDKPVKSMQKLKTQLGDAYLVEESDRTEIGNGIVEFQRTYASVPQPRVEYGTINFSRQQTINNKLIETQETVPAFIHYTFSLKPIKQIDAPRAVDIDGILFGKAGFGNFVPGKLVLAEDSEVGTYKGKIFYRRAVYIKWFNYTINGLVVT